MSLKAIRIVRQKFEFEDFPHAIRVRGVLDIVRRIDTTRRQFCIFDIERDEWHYPADGTELLIIVNEILSNERDAAN